MRGSAKELGGRVAGGRGPLELSLEAGSCAGSILYPFSSSCPAPPSAVTDKPSDTGSGTNLSSREVVYPRLSSSVCWCWGRNTWVSCMLREAPTSHLLLQPRSNKNGNQHHIHHILSVPQITTHTHTHTTLQISETQNNVVGNIWTCLCKSFPGIYWDLQEGCIKL